ncbi:MAG: hypothetical protein JWO16_2067 [Sphingomonas bacterium]|jgi:hypothetical protein|nr:hypothetical protein [Sphingomonas bacterium]
MSHEPPVPPDNQSPYPIAEPPHEHPAPLPPVAEKTGPPKALLIGGAIAAVGATALAGLAAMLLGRRKSKPSGPRPAAHKAPAAGRGRTRTRRGDA